MFYVLLGWQWREVRCETTVFGLVAYVVCLLFVCVCVLLVLVGKFVQESARNDKKLDAQLKIFLGNVTLFTVSFRLYYVKLSTFG